jgi:hypothetical protein
MRYPSIPLIAFSSSVIVWPHLFDDVDCCGQYVLKQLKLSVFQNFSVPSKIEVKWANPQNAMFPMRVGN